METLGMCIRFPGSDYDAARQALCFLRYFEQRSEEVFEAKQKPGRFSVAYHNGISGVMALRADIPVEEAGFCQTLWREMLEKSLEPMRCSNKLYSHWQQVTGFQKVLREACNGLGGWHQAGEHIHSPQHFVQIWPPEPCSLRSGWKAAMRRKARQTCQSASLLNPPRRPMSLSVRTPLSCFFAAIFAAFLNRAPPWYPFACRKRQTGLCGWQHLPMLFFPTKISGKAACPGKYMPWV